ncbi:hypothetical protein [Microbacterium sp. G2-8]|uniref:hypothetical protein n=1 Tax=Microbacterium sp. G2-8 TaxID=2842454 RepID=UPI001C88FBBE|nr:hypothetical protein [Microbacterium sp. G2-8]
MSTSTIATSPAPRRIGEVAHGRARARQILERGTAMEAAGWRSIGRWVTRRPVVPPGAAGFSYDKPIRTILIVFLALSAVEIPIIDLITHRWPLVRFPLLALGIWGVLTMLGMLLGYLTRPHAVGPGGIVARHGSLIAIDLPWEVVASVSRRRRALPEAPAASLTGPEDDAALNLVVQDGTDVDIVLEEPTAFELPQGSVVVTSVRIAVDDVPAFLDAVRHHIP